MAGVCPKRNTVGSTILADNELSSATTVKKFTEKEKCGKVLEIITRVLTGFWSLFFFGRRLTVLHGRVSICLVFLTCFLVIQKGEASVPA